MSNSNPNLLIQTEEFSDKYNSELEIENTGIGKCSKCYKITECVLINTHEVLCIGTENDRDNDTKKKGCAYKYCTWWYDDPIESFNSKRLNRIYVSDLISDSDESEDEYDYPDEYEVEEILDHKLEKGKMWFLIKWKDFEETTWEPKENMMCPIKIKEYYDKKSA